MVRRFGDLEAAIMEVVWTADRPLLTREVVQRLRSNRDPAYTTVQTVMDILFRKGWLSRELDGRAYRYRARASREDYTSGLLDDALAASTDRIAALARFVQRLDPAEASELRQLLEEKKSQGDPP